MEIKFLGTQNICGKCTSYIIDKHILFDCGFGTVRTMCDSYLDDKIDTVIISHLHPDHIGDIVYLILNCFIKKHPYDKLTIIAPKGTKHFIQNLNYATFCGDLKDNLDKYFSFFNSVMDNLVELEGGQKFKNQQMEITALQVIHGVANSNAYLLEITGEVIGCSGDTSACQTLFDNLHYAKTWIIDANGLAKSNSNKHLSLEEIEQIASANYKIKFYAIHRNDYPLQTRCGNIFFPANGETILL